MKKRIAKVLKSQKEELGLTDTQVTAIANAICKKVIVKDGNPSLDFIDSVVSYHSGVDIHVETRLRENVVARSMFYKAANKYSYTLEQIGNHLGKSYSTVIHGLKKIDSDLDYFKMWGIFDRIMNELEGVEDEL